MAISLSRSFTKSFGWTRFNGSGCFAVELRVA